MTDTGRLIEAIEALHKAAVRAPWHPDPPPYCEYIYAPDGQFVCGMRENHGAGMEDKKQANRDLIIALRNATPDILAAMRRLKRAEALIHFHAPNCATCGNYFKDGKEG